MPIIKQDELDFVSHSEAQTERVGMRLGQLCQAGDLICLEGDFGAGKTRLARGIGKGLGVAEPITSPTFVLVNEHRAPGKSLRFYHIDVYRLSSTQEMLGLGIEDYVYGDGVCVIEWAERAREILPRECLWVFLRHIDESRRGLIFAASGERYKDLLVQLKKSAFGLSAMQERGGL
jgi:tRNA threonylcarbamoyladenosine biosynthesis protein TsaE